MVRRWGVSGGFALVAFVAYGCGSNRPAAPIDASADAPTSEASVPDASADAPPDAPTVLPTLPPTLCDNEALLAGCQAGECTVSANGMPLPSGASLTVTRKPAPAGLNGDTLASVLCSIVLPPGLTTLPNLHLSISQSSPPDSNAVLFRYVSPILSELVTTSQSSGSAVDGLVTAPGDFGATERPQAWSTQGDVGLNVTSSGDQASLLLNLSSQAMSGAFDDGTHLFVCNGTRLLIYDAIPTGPAAKPDVVLGQPDLDTTSTQTTSSLFGNAGCSGLWSDGARLVVASGNRILIWNKIPTTNTAPADIVLGQSDFSSNTANAGGPSARSLSFVASVDSDGTRLAAAEVRNNRVLVWNTFPTTMDQPADFVIGQPDFTSVTAYGGATSIYQAWGALFASDGLYLSGQFSPGVVHLPAVAASNPAPDLTILPPVADIEPGGIFTAGRMARVSGGGLAVRDANQARVVVVSPQALASASTTPATISFVLGQPDALRVATSPVSASVVASGGTEEGLGGGSPLLVPDGNRLLVFDTPPTYNFEPASRVVGQAGFTTNGPVDYRAVSSTTLAGPGDVAVGSGVIAVADRGNNRVVLYPVTDAGAGPFAASVVLGQADSSSYVPNVDQQTPSASTLSGPSGVAIDAGHLIVADTENHRVLVWNGIPTTTGTPANLVLGQSDFSGRRPNHGRGDANGDGFSDAAADGFFYPTGVASDGTHLFVADRLNNRVLVWNTFPTANGQPADAVIGQADFSGSKANRGNGPFTVVPDGLDLPTGVTLDGTTLWVADTENNRVVRWDTATTAPTAGAFLGQATGTAVANPNYATAAPNTGTAVTPSPTGSTALRPRGVVALGGTLYVSEGSANRVHVFDKTTFASIAVLGQASDSVGTANAGGVAASSLSGPQGIASDGTTLWVSDGGNNRVVGFDVSSPPATGSSATFVLGQPTLSTNGFNEESTAANGVTSQPGGVALAGGNLYIADSGNHRVLVLKVPVAAGQAPVRVYGQSNMVTSLPNAGGSASARTLNTPRAVFADGTRLIIADTGNHRVLVYDPNSSSPDAQLVLGQPDLTSTAPNAGGAPGAATLQSPAGVFSDGTSLWVADSGNNRVLVWNSFPTKNGQAADAVLGQASFATNAPNQGGVASASSLSLPSSIDVVGGVAYIADTGNNRVVFFSSLPVTSGANATGVLGQADLTSRGATSSASDLQHLAGPAALADDGENLYVTDRDLARVVAFDLGTIASGASAALVVGSVGGLVMHAPAGLAAERTPFFTSRLYVADTGDNQVVIVQSVSRLALQ